MDQRSLFASGALSFDDDFATASRIVLDPTSWIDVVPGWLAGSDQLLDALVEGVAWEQRTRWMYDRMVNEPRLTAEYRSLHTVPNSFVAALAATLSRHYGVPYDQVWLNLYRHERESTSWHTDRFSCRRSECVVPVLTLGATRRFLLKSKKGGPTIRMTPASGDLIVMGGRCQRDWQHCVPKQSAPCGPRVSINFQSSTQATRDAVRD